MLMKPYFSLRRKRSVMLYAVLCLFTSLSGNAAATDSNVLPESLSRQVGQCMTCHGPAAVAENPAWPTLANQNERYLRQSLLAFRSGERQNDMMRLMTQQLTDDDISSLAHYFSQLRPKEGVIK